MRRLIRQATKLSLILLVGVFVTSATLSTHSNAGQGAQAGCLASCLTDGQHTGIGATKDEADKDDAEPTPPLLAWPQLPVNLELLYILPSFAVLWFASKRYKIHLTTQMRF